MQNETKRHFETRDLEGDAERVQQRAYKVVPKGHTKRQRGKRLLLLVALLLLLFMLAWMLGAFHPSLGLSA